MNLSRITSMCMVVALLSGITHPKSASGQNDQIVAELDEFWAGVVESVTQWNPAAQKATYHPDAVGVSGTADSYRTSNLWADFDAKAADPAAEEDPNHPILEFRFSSRVHDATTAHEVGLYHYWAEGEEHYYGTLDSYLVKKDGKWVILVEIQLEPAVTKAEWDALR